MVEKYGEAVVRTVDIVKWESVAAKQAIKETGLEGVPYVRVYGKDGKHLGDVDNAQVGEIEALVKKGLE